MATVCDEDDAGVAGCAYQSGRQELWHRPQLDGQLRRAAPYLHFPSHFLHPPL